jgi:hypothetical protein
MGPGTHIVTKVEKAVQPKTYADAIALTHDINYLLATADPYLLAEADDIAINKARYDIQGIFLKIGLTMRKITHLKEMDGAENPQLYRSQGLELRTKVLTSPDYANMRKKYGIDASYFL